MFMPDSWMLQHTQQTQMGGRIRTEHDCFVFVSVSASTKETEKVALFLFCAADSYYSISEV